MLNIALIFLVALLVLVFQTFVYGLSLFILEDEKKSLQIVVIVDTLMMFAIFVYLMIGAFI